MASARTLVGAACLALLTPLGVAYGDELAVAVDNQSRPTLCTEEDNVTLRLQSPAVRSFRIEARHPAYIGTLTVDHTAPNFRHCNLTPNSLA
jgi:hypothetical protein